MSSPLIALMTDYGDRDGFVGVVKGVILSILPDQTMLDIAHDLPPHNVRHASWVLAQAYQYVPEPCVFMAVVDPAVGDPSQGYLVVSIEDTGKVFVLPDNGLITRVLRLNPAHKIRAFHVNNPIYFRTDREAPSQTFHGRDIYAPIAAYLSKAMTDLTLESIMESMGPEVTREELVMLDLPPAENLGVGTWHGEVDLVDRFGNLLTNIPNDWLDACPMGASGAFQINGQAYPLAYDSHYGAGSSKSLVLVPGSHGCGEIALKGQSAQRALKAEPGQTFKIQLKPSESAV